jgi:predicted metal-binding membrane protein
LSAEASPFHVRDYRLLTILLVFASGLAWFALWRFGHSPYVHYMHHAHLHAPPGGGGHLVSSLIFVGGWTVMTVAMMLPTSLPLVGLFSKIASARPERGLLVGLVIFGYLSVWAGFGLVAYVGAVLFRGATAQSGWLRENGWVLGAGTLLVAGAFQFSSLKYKCLDKCRSPFSFVVEHWRGEHYKRQSLWLGVHHGLFCVGCCWTLMLLMFPFGAGNLAWMLFLGILMAIEKNVPWGRRLGKPLGVVLLVAGLLVVLRIDARLGL